MLQRILFSVFLSLAFIANSAFVYASTRASTTIGISVVVPERAENQQCTVGFQSNTQYTALNNTGCRYDSNELLRTAHQQAISNTALNNQGFVTVIITAP